MTGPTEWTDGNALTGPLHDVSALRSPPRSRAAATAGGPGRWRECGCSTTRLAWSPAVRPATRCFCGWCAAPAAPGWTCAAWTTCNFPWRTRPEAAGRDGGRDDRCRLRVHDLPAPWWPTARPARPSRMSPVLAPVPSDVQPELPFQEASVPQVQIRLPGG